MANVPEIDPSDRMADYDDEPRGGGKPRWGRRILTGLVAAAALGGFAVVVVFSLETDEGADTAAPAPVVKAQSGPTKVKPAEPGGMKIPDQDKQVFARLDPNAPKNTVERLLPPPKRLVEKPPPLKPAPAAELELSPGPILAPPPMPRLKPPPVMEAPPPAPPPEPKIAVVKKAPAPLPEIAVATAAAAKVAPAAGGFRVQLVALRSEAAARVAWSGYLKKHADLFGKLKPTFAKAVIKGKGTFYRLQAGPLADAGAARVLCEKVKKRKMGCLVVRP